jgi:competence ComEA-like helix-hairpin-helix protein
MKKRWYVLYGLLALIALGLVFTALNRYEPYRRFIDLEGFAEGGVESSRGESEKTEKDTGQSDQSESGRLQETAAHQKPEFPVDLNSADLETLILLPGVGPVTASHIVDYRTRSGGFRSVKQLLEVRGIGAKKLEILKDYVIIGIKE